MVRNLPETLLVRDKGPLVAKREQSQDSTRSSDRVALGSALIGGIIAAVIAWRLASWAGQGSAGIDVLGISATNQPAHVQVGAQPQPSSPVTATPVVAATPQIVVSDRAHVTNTDGQGVVLRNSPREDDRMPRGFMDGDSVTVLERSGPDWAHVRGDNGLDGWVPSRYLAPD